MVLLPDMIRGVLSGKDAFLSVQDGKIRAIRPTPPHAQLTTSEVEILRHISQGLSVTQIAARLMRSKKTISTHKRRAMRKLELSDDLSLALYLRESSPDEAGAGCARASDDARVAGAAAGGAQITVEGHGHGAHEVPAQAVTCTPPALG